MGSHRLNRSPPPSHWWRTGALVAAVAAAAGASLASARHSAANEAPVRGLADGRPTFADSAEARERRILDEISHPSEPAAGIERLTGPLPTAFVTSRFEQALDPRLLQRFGGPGLDPEDLHAAMNGALRAGGSPHLNMAMGLLAYGGLKQLEKLRLLEKVRAPHVRLGVAGSGFGMTGSLPRVDGGVYVLPPRSAGVAPGRRLLATLRGLGLPGLRPKPLAQGRLELEQVASPGGLSPASVTHAARVVVPLPACRGARVDLAAGMSVTTVGAQSTRVRNLRPSIRVRQLVLDLDLRHIDLGPVSYLDGAMRASVAPLRIEARVRQDPWRHRPPILEARLQTSDLMPRLKW